MVDEENAFMIKVQKEFVMIKLLPTPKSCQTLGEGRISLAAAVCTDHKEFVPYQATLGDFFARAFDMPLALDTEGGIVLCFDADLAPDAYVIEGARVCASAPEGLCYAFASLLQLLEAEGEGITLPHVRIEDRPDKPYRSLTFKIYKIFSTPKPSLQASPHTMPQRNTSFS